LSEGLALRIFNRFGRWTWVVKLYPLRCLVHWK